MAFVTEDAIMRKLQREFGTAGKIRIIDAAEVGDDEGNDVLVVVAHITHRAMPSINMPESESVRYMIYRHDDDIPMSSGIVR